MRKKPCQWTCPGLAFVVEDSVAVEQYPFGMYGVDGSSLPWKVEVALGGLHVVTGSIAPCNVLLIVGVQDNFEP